MKFGKRGENWWKNGLLNIYEAATSSLITIDCHRTLIKDEINDSLIRWSSKTI